MSTNTTTVKTHTLTCEICGAKHTQQTTDGEFAAWPSGWHQYAIVFGKETPSDEAEVCGECTQTRTIAELTDAIGRLMRLGERAAEAVS